MTATSPAIEPDQMELFISASPDSRPIIQTQAEYLADRRKKHLTIYQHGVTRATIVNQLAAHPMTLQALSRALNRINKTVHNHLTRLVRSGAIVRLAHGFYALNENSMPELAKAKKHDPDHVRLNAFVVLT